MRFKSLEADVKKKELESEKIDSVTELEFFKDKFCTFNNKNIIPFKLRNYQQEYLELFKNSIQPKLFLHLPRRAGKDVFCFSVMVDYALEHIGNYAYILPDREQASKVIWRGVIINRDINRGINGDINDGINGGINIEKPEIIRFLDIIPKALISNINNQEKVITLTNGSVIYLHGATRPDSLRGINLRGVVFSEFAFYRNHEVYQVLQPVITQSKAWVIINTTPNDYNFSWRLFKTLRQDPRWVTKLETVKTLCNADGVRYITDLDVQNCKIDGNMSEDDIKREFYCEPSLNSECLYYASEMKAIDDEHRIHEVQIKHNLPIHFAFDLGSDATPVIGFQIEIGGTIRVVFYHKPTKEVYTYGWYYHLIKEYVLKNTAIMGKCILPHDAVKRQVNETTISSAKQAFTDAGADIKVLKRCNNKDALINLSKIYLNKVIFDEKTTHLIDSLSSYSREFDEKYQVFAKKPRHDWASHGADCWQYVCQAIDEGNLSIKKIINAYKWGDK